MFCYCEYCQQQLTEHATTTMAADMLMNLPAAQPNNAFDDDVDLYMEINPEFEGDVDSITSDMIEPLEFEYAVLAGQIHDLAMEQYPNIEWDDIMNFMCRSNEKMTRADWRRVLNTPIYDWYYGNILNFIITIAFMPDLGERGPMDKRNIRKAINFVYKLLEEDMIDLTMNDYYGTSPIDHINFMFMKVVNPYKIPRRIVVNTAYCDMLLEMLYALENVVKNHVRIRNITNHYIRGWIRRHRKKVAAAQTIQAYWREYAYNPYTPFGERMLKKRATAWNHKYLSI